MKHTVLQIVLVGLAISWGSVSSADVWPQLRGSTGDGISREKNLPVKWSADSGIAWTCDLPGRANSSPAVTANRIDLTSQTEDKALWVISVDRKTGKIFRQTKVGAGTLDANADPKLWSHRHNAATPSPIADDEHVWAFFGTGLLVCVDAKSGNVTWKKDLVADYGKYDVSFGMGSTPRLWGDLIYVACMTKGPSYVVALNKQTGKEVWKSDRKLPAADDGPDAYSTPFVWQHDGRAELLVSGSDHVNSYDLKTGKQNWVSDGLTVKSLYGRVIASPVAADGIVVATSASPGGGGLGHVLAVKGDGQGDVSRSHQLWRLPKTTPDSSTPVALDGKVYLTTDSGIATCVDIKTGEQFWQKRLGTGPFHAGLVAGDGKVYALGIDGKCVVLEAGVSGKVLSENQLAGTFYATPAISDGVIYLRAYERLYAISRAK
jgi:outer membrane protein assembly factor BamB